MAADVQFPKTIYNFSTLFENATGTSTQDLHTALGSTHLDGGFILSMYITNNTGATVTIDILRNTGGSDIQLLRVSVPANSGLGTQLTSPLSDGQFPSSIDTVGRYYLPLNTDTVYKAKMTSGLGVGEEVVVHLDILGF